MERRDFIRTTATGLAGITLSNNLLAKEVSEPETKYPIHVYTKCLQFLSIEEIAEVLAANGFDGADLAVRPGGQILPENVKSELPQALKILKNAGVGSNMIVTAINNPDDPLTRDILKTMADTGIQYYRMGYISYDANKSVPQNLEAHKVTFQKFEKINKEYGVHGDYQNHSGTRVGGPVWDLYHLLMDRDPAHIGVQYDIRHAMVEGGTSWPLGLKLLAPWIRTTDIKDFIWEKDESGKWKITNVPLGEGMVNFNTYLEMYKSLCTPAPVSIHYEYDLGGAEHGKNNPTMSRDEIFGYLKKDIVFLKEQFLKTGIK